MIIGPRVRPPYLAWVLLVVLVLVEGGAGVLGGLTNGGIVVEGGLLGAVANMAFVMLVVGWQPLVMALVVGVPRWGDRRRRRRMIAELADCRVGSAVGKVAGGPDGAGPVRVGTDLIAVAEGAPPLPPPGTYRLYWLELRKSGRGPLLSVQPLDES